MEQLGGLVVSVVAVLFALIALLYSRSSARRARAANTAAEAAAASARSAQIRVQPEGWVDVPRPTADEPASTGPLAATGPAALATVPAAEVPTVPWELAWQSGSDYRLTNATGAPAREIEIATRDDGPRLQDHDCGDLEPGEVIAFSAAGYVGMADNRVTVTWYGPDTNLQVWRSELPG